MNTSLRTLIERNFAAVEAKYLEAVLQCFAEDAVFIDPHYPSPVMIGKVAITDGLRWAFNGMKRFGLTLVSYGEWADGQHAAVEMATHHILQTGMQLRWICNHILTACTVMSYSLASRSGSCKSEAMAT